MAIRSELTVRIANTPGALGRVCQLLAEERVNILGLALEASGVVRLVVDNHVHATGVLEERHFKVEHREILYTLTPNEPGTLAHIVQLLADAGVNLEYAYATAVEGHTMAGVVIGVADAQRASAASGL